MQVTVKFGLTNRITKEFPDGSRLNAVLGNQSVKVALAFGDNVQAVIDGVVQTGNPELSDGDVVSIETRVSTKA